MFAHGARHVIACIVTHRCERTDSDIPMPACMYACLHLYICVCMCHACVHAQTHVECYACLRECAPCAVAREVRMRFPSVFARMHVCMCICVYDMRMRYVFAGLSPLSSRHSGIGSLVAARRIACVFGVFVFVPCLAQVGRPMHLHTTKWRARHAVDILGGSAISTLAFACFAFVFARDVLPVWADVAPALHSGAQAFRGRQGPTPVWARVCAGIVLCIVFVNWPGCMWVGRPSGIERRGCAMVEDVSCRYAVLSVRMANALSWVAEASSWQDWAHLILLSVHVGALPPHRV